MTNKQAAMQVIKTLSGNGFQAFLAGGYVRDMLLGRGVKDFDVATDAKPEIVAGLFSRTLNVGAKFGVVIVLLGGKQVEVATFRNESGYVDGRHPLRVEFTSAQEDAARRDFTINGMFYDQRNDKIIDYIGGQEDLKRKIIRTIGSPDERFGEDYLRMLRAVRFSTQLGFEIEPQTWAAVCRGAGNIARISGERIAMEMEWILTDPNRDKGVLLLAESGMAAAIFGTSYPDQIKFAAEVLKRLRKKVDFALGLAGFFVGFSAKDALEKIRVLKLSRSRTKHVKFLLDGRGSLLDERLSMGQLRMVLAEPHFWDLYELHRAIQRAKGEGVNALVRLRKRIKSLGDIEPTPKPLLDGHELMRLGAEPGPSLGALADEMYMVQLEGKLQTAEQAEKWVRGRLKNSSRTYGKQK